MLVVEVVVGLVGADKGYCIGVDILLIGADWCYNLITPIYRGHLEAHYAIVPMPWVSWTYC